MINKELELTINQQDILGKLANNLGITTVTDNTSIKKIADAFEAELRNYSDATEDALRNGFLSTMDEELFEDFAASYGIYKKKYGSIRLRSIEQVVEIAVDESTLFSKNLINFTPFLKGDVIYSDSAFSVKVLNDVTFNNTSSAVYPHIEISLRDADSFSIPADIYYLIRPQQSELNVHTPQYKLTFKNTIGLAMAEEDNADFRLRVYEATYLANNMANSLIAAVTKDVPYLYHLETENIEEGRAVQIIYPYTKELIETGIDPLLQAVVVPMVETSLMTKTLSNNMTRVKEPKSLPIIAKFRYKNNISPTQSMLSSISVDFNSMYFSRKSIKAREIKEQLIFALYRYNLELSDIDLIFISPDLDEETFILNDEEVIEIPVGKFLTILSLEGVTNDK